MTWPIIENFHDYLYSAPTFVVYSDNNLLTFVLTSAKLNATGCRWVAELTDFHFTIKYHHGKESIDADSLFKMPLDIGTMMKQCRVFCAKWGIKEWRGQRHLLETDSSGQKLNILLLRVVTV